MPVVGMLGPPEIIVIVVVLVLLFGAKRLPELARSLGSSARELRKGLAEGAEEDEGEAVE
ncbi:MAG: twin-arginine translocase TatA/TatE family subunit [Acidimicrobiia bacterium]